MTAIPEPHKRSVSGPPTPTLSRIDVAHEEIARVLIMTTQPLKELEYLKHKVIQLEHST